MSINKPRIPPPSTITLPQGLYAQFLTPPVQAAVQVMPDDEVNDELDLARLCLVRALKERDAAQLPREKLSWDLASRGWLELVLDAKFRKLELGQALGEVWDTFTDAVRIANERQVITQ